MAVTTAVATIFAAGVTIVGQMEASKRADEAAADEKALSIEEAAAIEAETAESVRRAKDKAAKVEGESRARAAGSGAEISGSIDISLDSMSEEHTRQIDWMGKAGASRARMALMGGEMRAKAQSARADTLTANMWGTAAGGVSSTYTAGGSQGAGWWS